MYVCYNYTHVESMTYIELEHAQLNQHVVLLGVVNRRGRHKLMICSARGKCLVLRSRKKVSFSFLPLSTFDRTYQPP